MMYRHCGSKKIVQKGKRKLSKGENQIFLCKNCGKKFSFEKGKFNNKIIIFAVSSYNSGKSFEECCKLIKKKYKVNVSEMTISRWVKKDGKSFNRIRKKLIEKHPGEVVRSKRLIHSGLIYEFLVHNSKLKEFCKYEGLNSYLNNVDSWIDKYFVESKRCSQMKMIKEVNVKEYKNFICDAVGKVLLSCSENKERYSAVQKYLLYNDSATIACEVPIWMWDKNIGAVSGHIDILQVRFGKVWVMDYKPGAMFENKLKVGTQLYWYARALSFRARIPLSNIKCCWFDEQACFEFDPSHVKIENSFREEE